MLGTQMSFISHPFYPPLAPPFQEGERFADTQMSSIFFYLPLSSLSPILSIPL